MHSSQNEQDSRHYARAAKVPMLEPSDSQEAKDFTVLAYELSEKFDVPVMIRLHTRVSHSRSLVEICDRKEAPLKEYTKDCGKYVMMPGMARMRHVVVEERQKALQEYAESSELNVVEMNDTKIGIICSGICYQYAKEALPNASFLKLGMIYPLPPKKIAEFAKSVNELYIIEELDPFIETFVQSLGIKVIGKERFSVLGEYIAEKIAEAILGKKTETSDISLKEELPGRPRLCVPDVLTEVFSMY